MDQPTADQRSSLMRRVRKINTAPEVIVRRQVWRLGHRYRLHDKRLPGTPDIVFRRLRKVIEVRGCFWHAHNCRRGNQPRSRADFWAAKFARNKLRFRRNLQRLRRDGWKVMIIWECQTRDEERLDSALKRFLEEYGPDQKFCNSDIA